MTHTTDDHGPGALPVGTQYHVPDTGDRLPYRHNPFAADLVGPERARVRPVFSRLFGPELAERILVDEGIPDWACYPFTFADGRRMRLLIQASLANIAWDDAMTRTHLSADVPAIRNRTQRFTDVINGHQPPTEHLGEHVLWKAHQGVEALCSPAFATRFRRLCHDINQSMIDESHHRNGAELPEWDDYLTFRRINLFGFWVTAMAEFSVGVDMTDLLATQPEVRAVELVAIDHILFGNDLYSFPKEARTGEIANTMWILLRDGMSLQGAVNHLARLVVSKQNEFLTLRNQLLTGPLATHPAVPDYLDALAHVLGGCLHYHRTNRRYHGPNHDGTPVNDGTIHIGPDGSTFTPAIHNI